MKYISRSLRSANGVVMDAREDSPRQADAHGHGSLEPCFLDFLALQSLWSGSGEGAGQISEADTAGECCVSEKS